MKSIVVALLLLLFNNVVFAQLKRPAPPQKKIDSLKMACPIPGGVMQSPSKEGYGYKGDVKVILKNVNDTLFLSPVDGQIDLITMGEDGRYDIVMHYFNYNIWFTGISKSLVKKNDKLKTGQPVGRINPGDEVEILLFNDEEPVDPRKYLECRSE